MLIQLNTININFLFSHIHVKVKFKKFKKSANVVCYKALKLYLKF